MTARSKALLAALWALSLLATAHWTATAQTAQVGQEVRFLRSQGDGGTHRGVLISNFGGQWLPVELTTMPDGNALEPVKRPR